MPEEEVKPAEETIVVTQEMLNENPVLKEHGVEVGAIGQTELAEKVVGKPVGPAIVVQDDPIEQFPVHDENTAN